jgi:hypothetical protein
MSDDERTLSSNGDERRYERRFHVDTNLATLRQSVLNFTVRQPLYESSSRPFLRLILWVQMCMAGSGTFLVPFSSAILGIPTTAAVLALLGACCWYSNLILVEMAEDTRVGTRW